MPTKKNILAGVLLPAAGLASTLLSLTAAHAIVQMTYLTNYVGDIVSFVPSSSPPVEDGVRLIVHRRDQFGCILDLDVLRQSGGSLIVEGQVKLGNDMRCTGPASVPPRTLAIVAKVLT
jgi:hypothetical protein